MSRLYQTLNLSFYPKERGPYNNLDADNIADNGSLLFPEKRWGGIMRKIETTPISRIQTWVSAVHGYIDPFMTPTTNTEGGTCISISETFPKTLKDGMKAIEQHSHRRNAVSLRNGMMW